MMLVMKRAFWRFPLWQRTVVLVAGSATHFALALAIFYVAALTTGRPNPAAQSFDPAACKQAIAIGLAQFFDDDGRSVSHQQKGRAQCEC